MKITMIKHPRNGSPLAFFSKYEWAECVARTMFPKYEITQALEEMELDPAQSYIESGFFPWTVTVDVAKQEARVDDARSWFDKESVEYFQGPSALARVFSRNEEEAENRALELWAEYSGQKNIHTRVIWDISFDEEAQIQSVHRYNSYSVGDVKDGVISSGNHVSARVVADTIQEAVEKAGALYDEWIDKQIMDEAE